MSDNQQYNLWFVNQSASAGKVCIYQNINNLPCNGVSKQLAWMLTGANPSVQVNFIWGADYNFVWFDYDLPETQQITAANVSTGEVINFCKNQYGYYFQTPTTVTTNGQLTIQSEGTIPSVNNTVVGIGMHGAGTFAFNSGPNLDFVFNPVSDANLLYWISFGNYSFKVNDVIDISTLNSPGMICFPYGVYTMTAVLNSSNQWNIYPGAPIGAIAKSDDNKMVTMDIPTVIYEAGRGRLF